MTEIQYIGLAPTYAHEGDAGGDLRAAITRPITIRPRETAWVPLGVKCAIPEGYFGLLTPRSGLGLKHGITFTNSVGIIDSGYRGEISTRLVNLGDAPFTIHPADRVAQLIIVPFVSPTWVKVDSLDATQRGEDGFGSSGVE